MRSEFVLQRSHHWLRNGYFNRAAFVRRGTDNRAFFEAQVEQNGLDTLTKKWHAVLKRFFLFGLFSITFEKSPAEAEGTRHLTLSLLILLQISDFASPHWQSGDHQNADREMFQEYLNLSHLDKKTTKIFLSSKAVLFWVKHAVGNISESECHKR